MAKNRLLKDVMDSPLLKTLKKNTSQIFDMNGEKIRQSLANSSIFILS